MQVKASETYDAWHWPLPIHTENDGRHASFTHL